MDKKELNTLKMAADRSSNNRMCKVHGNSILAGCVCDHLTKKKLFLHA